MASSIWTAMRVLTISVTRSMMRSSENVGGGLGRREGEAHEGVDLFFKFVKLLLKVLLEFFKGGGEWVGGRGGGRRVRGW